MPDEHINKGDDYVMKTEQRITEIETGEDNKTEDEHPTDPKNPSNAEKVAAAKADAA